MRVIDIAQRTPEWHVWRKGGVTGTDAAALLGLSDKKTAWRIWAEKLGKVEPEDLSGNPNVQRGVALEPVARKAIEDKYDLMLMPFCGEHDKHSILRASFDGVDDNGRPAEIKCPGDKVWEAVKKDGENAAEYQRYYCQVQHQILVAGSDSALLVYFHDGELLEFDIQKDEAMHQEIIEKAEAFWEMVQAGKEPAKDPLLDIFVPTGAERGQWMTLAEDRRRISAFLASAEAQVKTLKGQIKKTDDALMGLMGNFVRAECDGIAITRYTQQGNVDWKSLIADLLPDLELTEDLLAKYRGKESSRSRITQTDTKEAEKKASEKRKRVKKPEVEKEQEPPASVYAW